MDWIKFHNREKGKEYYKELVRFLNGEYVNHTCYPPMHNVLNAFELTPFDSVKCVILGQDPYHEPGQAMGLAFSVPKGVTIPRSLKNIYKEIEAEYGYPVPDHGDLTSWARQGVLLLNTVLTVREHAAGSHAGHGWEIFTDNIIKELNNSENPIVFMLWGNKAREKRNLISGNHLVLEAAHPSPFSANKGFFGCGHFKKCNDWLEKHGVEPIDWRIA